MLIYYVLTKVCNLECNHCIREYNSQEIEFMNFDNAVLGIKKLDTYFPKGYNLAFSGGEPTIHPYFEKLLKFSLNNSICNIGICTNGVSSFFDEAIFRYDPKTSIFIQVSLDGAETSHDKIRGNGVFKRAIRNLKNLINAGFTVSVASTVTKDNLDSMFILKEILLSLKVLKWRINMALPYGSAEDSQCLNITQWNDFVQQINLNNTSNMKISCYKLYDFKTLDSLNEHQLQSVTSIRTMQKMFNCGSGNRKIYIYPDMKVYGCTCLKEFPFGNLIDQDLNDVFNSENAQLIKNYTILERSPCKQCKYLKMCNGGCIGMSKIGFNQIGIGDIRCPKLQQKIRGEQ